MRFRFSVFDNGKENGNYRDHIRVIQGLDWDNGKEA